MSSRNSFRQRKWEFDIQQPFVFVALQSYEEFSIEDSGVIGFYDEPIILLYAVSSDGQRELVWQNVFNCFGDSVKRVVFSLPKLESILKEEGVDIPEDLPGYSNCLFELRYQLKDQLYEACYEWLNSFVGVQKVIKSGVDGSTCDILLGNVDSNISIDEAVAMMLDGAKLKVVDEFGDPWA